jgi:PAS domain S-box-containing protein
MGIKLTKLEENVLGMLLSGHSDEECCIRLRVKEEGFRTEWDSVARKVLTATPTTIEDYRLLSSYERAERMRMQSKIWATESRLTALMDISPEAILVVSGRNGQILRANNRAFTMLGYSPRELIGQPMEILMEPEKRALHVGLRHSFLNNQRKRELGMHPLVLAYGKDGREVVLEIGLTATMATDDVMVICKELTDDDDDTMQEGWAVIESEA